jgi:hypothetical protein
LNDCGDDCGRSRSHDAVALEYKKENDDWKYFKEEFHGSFPVRKKIICNDSF